MNEHTPQVRIDETPCRMPARWTAIDGDEDMRFRSTPTAKLLLFAIMVPLAFGMFGESTRAQGLLDPGRGNNYSGGKGGWLNNPNSRFFNRARSQAAIEFNGDHEAKTEARVLRGQPTIELSGHGTSVKSGSSSETISLLLDEKDGPARCCLSLPEGFKGGIASLQSQGYSLYVPIWSERFLVDVPGLLGMATVGVTQLQITFASVRRGKVDQFTIILDVDAGNRSVRLTY